MFVQTAFNDKFESLIGSLKKIILEGLETSNNVMF